MGTIIYDSDRLSAMTESLVEYDDKGNVFEYMGICDHLDDISVEDLLEAQRRAIEGGGGGGSSSGSTSGDTMDITPESPDNYSEWENIVNP